MATATNLPSANRDGHALALSAPATLTSASSAASAPSDNIFVAVSQDVSGATVFTLFRRMPLELRNKVWSYTVPDSQQITLEHLCYISGACDDASKGEWLQQDLNQLPVGLFVNKESRLEVLRIMKKVNFNKLSHPIDTAVMRPVYTTKSDLFTVEFSTLLYEAGDFYDRISALDPVIRMGITKLEVRNTFTLFFIVKLFVDNTKKNLTIGNPADFRKLYCGSFLSFPALKEIIFTGRSSDGNWENAADKISLKSLEVWIVKFLQASKTAFNNDTVSFHTFFSANIFDTISGPKGYLPPVQVYRRVSHGIRCLKSFVWNFPVSSASSDEGRHFRGVVLG
ncbi:hypothetical protein VTL71DRAFT_796 [Oculimacula yallundae]|uniref:2EXR domain-containing protein n=1 Tax=Oculimacula yallundae TaxID=86028 RepID=A0ABR4D147_9HELO